MQLNKKTKEENQMKKRHTIKAVAILLVLSLCLSILPSSVLAVPVGKSTDSDSPTLEDFYAGNATAEDLYGKLDEAIVPEIIGYETAVAKNHVGRLYEDEGTDLNKIVFLNVDGSKTMYLFDFPVKYVDETGSIQDIRLEIADGTTESGKFQTAANDAVTRFPAKFTDGISLEGNDTEIRLVPVLTTANSGTATMATNSMTTNAVANATAQRIDKNTIEYRYDNKTTVEYSLTYTGFKEDIVVSEYTGQTTYPFRLYTNGLALEEMDGSHYLVDDDGNIKATIGNIIIFTADERNNAFGDIVPTTIVENEEYLLNIVVDADYLADPDTIYPIRIDPTIEINYDNNGGSAIEDITISTNKNFSGSHDSLYVGRRSTEGIARALMRFPGLNLSNLAGATVTSATVQLRDLMCESDELAISCHVFTGNVWNASSATWANVSPNSYVSTAMSANTMSWSIGKTHSPVHWYSFDISSAVQGWINGTYTQNKGIIFKVAPSVENGSTIANRTFGSFNRASYKPSLSITYVRSQSTYTISNYIDQGYRVRFDGYDNVLAYNSVVASKFQQLFGLNAVSTYVLHTSSADNCKAHRFGSVTSDNLAAACTHAATHLTSTALRNTMGDGTNLNSRVIWTGHIMTGNPASTSDSSRYSVVITPLHTTTGSNYTNKSDSEVRKESIFTLMHELSHQLGAPDHYCGGIKEGQSVCSNTNCDVCYMGMPQPRTCIMSYRYDIEARNVSTLYCSSCQAVINDHLMNHHQ